jgi:putative ABC transport system substrate-binding protein
MARLRATAPAARSVLDGREHGGTLGRVGNRSTPIRPSKSAQEPPSKTEITLNAARTLGVRLIVLNANDQSEFESAFAAFVRERAGGIVVGSQPLFFSNVDRLVALPARHRVPAIYAWREAAMAGGFMNYNADLASANRLAGTYIGRILKGEKPTDLPVQRSTKIELVVNLKTAKTLGVEVPTRILVRADEVIE